MPYPSIPAPDRHKARVRLMRGIKREKGADCPESLLRGGFPCVRGRASIRMGQRLRCLCF